MLAKNYPQIPVHPFFNEQQELWRFMLAAFKGQDSVTENFGDEILIYPNGLSEIACTTNPAVSDEIKEARKQYKRSAEWSPLLRTAIESLLGKIAAQLPTIELPPAMEYLRESATPDKQSLYVLYLKGIIELILYGRTSLLVDLPSVVENLPQPKIVLIPTLNLINWDVNADLELSFAVIQATKDVRVGLNWIDGYEFTLLMLDNGVYKWLKTTNQSELSLIGEYLEPFEVKGKTVNFIPLTIINNNDLSVTPQATFSPLFKGLIDILTKMYSLSAKINYQLRNQGNDTLVISGNIRNQDGADSDKPLQLGVGRFIQLMAGGTAEYIGINSQGLPLLMEWYQKAENLAYNFAGVLNPNDISKDASGKALETRIQELDGVLNTITSTYCAGLNNSLRQIAKMLGLNENAVNVINASTDLEIKLPIADIVALNKARYMDGLPISEETIHNLLLQNGYTQKEFDEEMAGIEMDNAKLGDNIDTFPNDAVVTQEDIPQDNLTDDSDIKIELNKNE